VWLVRGAAPAAGLRILCTHPMGVMPSQQRTFEAGESRPQRWSAVFCVAAGHLFGSFRITSAAKTPIQGPFSRRLAFEQFMRFLSAGIPDRPAQFVQALAQALTASGQALTARSSVLGELFFIGGLTPCSATAQYANRTPISFTIEQAFQTLKKSRQSQALRRAVEKPITAFARICPACLVSASRKSAGVGQCGAKAPVIDQ